MFEPIKSRAHFWRLIFFDVPRRTRWIASSVAALSSLYAAFVFYRDELASAEFQERAKLLNYIPHWSWQGWAIVALLIALFIALEASYRHSSSLNITAAPQRNAWLSEAVFYGVRKRWPDPGEKLFQGDLKKQELYETEDGKSATTVLRNIRQAARDGGITIWGIEKPENLILGASDWGLHTFEPIDSIHWKDYLIDPYLLNFGPHIIWTQRSDGELDDGSYCALMVNKPQVENALEFEWIAGVQR